MTHLAPGLESLDLREQSGELPLAHLVVIDHVLLPALRDGRAPGPRHRHQVTLVLHLHDIMHRQAGGRSLQALCTSGGAAMSLRPSVMSGKEESMEEVGYVDVKRRLYLDLRDAVLEAPPHLRQPVQAVTIITHHAGTYRPANLSQLLTGV